MEQLLKSKTCNDDLDKINSRFEYCSQRIDSHSSSIKISLDNIATALWKQYFGGISVHQLYLLSDPTHRPKLDLSDIAPHIKYYQLDGILQTVKNLALECRKFDMLDIRVIYAILARQNIGSGTTKLQDLLLKKKY